MKVNQSLSILQTYYENWKANNYSKLTKWRQDEIQQWEREEFQNQVLGITRKPTKQNNLGNRYGMTLCRDDNGKDEGQTKE